MVDRINELANPKIIPKYMRINIVKKIGIH